MSAFLSKTKKLDAKDRLRLVLEVIEKNKPVSRVCKRAKISRSLFYQLKKQYLQAGESRKAKLRALEPKREWARRGRQLSRGQIRQILRVILENPQHGITKIIKQIYAKKHKRVVSHGGIQTLLLKLDLNTKRKRKAFVKWMRQLPRDEVIDLILLALKRYKAEEVLSPEERLKAVRLVVDGVPVAYVCQAFQISRRSFYKWQERYNQAVPGKEYQSVTDKKPIIERYWRQATKKQVEAILKIVIKHPEYSTHKVSVALPKIADKPLLGNHGVQNVFRRLNLNTYEKRLTYAQAYRPIITPVTRVLGRIKPVLEQIPAISAIPPPTREKIAPLARPFIASLFSSVAFFTIFIYWLHILSQAPTLGAKLGLFFASVSLLVGGFFFAYSMKYYLTLALVLSFSRQPLGEGGGFAVTLNGRLNNNNQRNNNKGNWLARIFGLSEGKADEAARPGQGFGGQAGGLQPSLDHIKLKRYPFVSIHLPFYNEKKVAERILKACTLMDYPNFEIIVCDDSTDETTDIVQRYVKKHNAKHPHGPKIKVLHRPTRKGFKGGALSYALKHMDPRTEFVVVFDADFIPYPDTLELFIKYFKAQNHGLHRSEKDDTDAEDYTKSNIAVVGGYQWHVLNKSENWITRGVRTEYAGSYVIERPGREILGLLKQISGAVYMIRADVLKKVGWGTSITEDFQLTLRLYAQGYKVIYTPYVQAPAECVSTLKRLIRQRMRWAEGHSNNIRKMFPRLIFSPKLSLTEKLELLYLSPYYLQAAFFMVGTFSWLLAETIFRARLPFWTSLWGWSLVLTNFFALPLMNAVGLFLEESEQKDYVGLLSFIFLSYVLVPFQAYASIKGFLEKEEGPWFRTPKTGKITDIFTRGRFYRWVSGIIPGRRLAPALAAQTLEKLNPNPHTLSPYLALATANNRFNSFTVRSRRRRWLGKTGVALFLILTIMIHTFPFFVPPTQATFTPAWYDTDWTYRAKLTIDNTKVSGSSNLSDFPVLVSVTRAELKDTANSGHVGKSDGTDILFTNSSGTKLDHEIERYTNTSGELIAWVEVDTLDYNDDTDIYIYYGYASATDQQNVTGTWNTNFKAVHHMQGASYTALDDSTSNNVDVTGETSSPSYQQTGQVGYAVSFDGTDDDLGLSSPAAIDDVFDGGGTFEAWIYSDSTIGSNSGNFWSKGTSGPIFHHYYKPNGEIEFVAPWNGTVADWRTPLSSFTTDAWHYVAVTYDTGSTANDPTIYIGESSQSPLTEEPGPTGTRDSDAANDLSFANRGLGGNRPFGGLLDEIRFSTNSRSAGWIVTSYNSQSSPSTFIKTWGSEEEVPELVLLLLPIALVTPVIIKYIRRKKYAKIRLIS